MMGVSIYGKDKANGLQIVVFGMRIDSEMGALGYGAAFPLVITQILSSLIAHSLHNVTSIRFFDQH